MVSGKLYSKNNNTVVVEIVEQTQENWLKAFAEIYSDEYLVSDVTDYEINDNVFKYIIATNSVNKSYIFFLYSLDENNTYLVIIETTDGDISIEDVNNFLDISVSSSSVAGANSVAEQIEKQLEEQSETIDDELGYIENSLNNNRSESLGDGYGSARNNSITVEEYY